MLIHFRWLVWAVLFVVVAFLLLIIVSDFVHLNLNPKLYSLDFMRGRNPKLGFAVEKVRVRV